MSVPFGKEIITVYKSKYHEKRKETTWSAVVLSGCFWKTTQITNSQDMANLKGAKYIVQAPYIDDFKPQIGDIVVRGMEVFDVPVNQPIEPLLDGKEFFRASKVDDNTGDEIPLPHFLWGN